MLCAGSDRVFEGMTVILTHFVSVSFVAMQNKRVFLEVNPTLIDVSDFDCVLCYRTLWKPVVTPCGHTYCMVSNS